jgi:hypothetical protein
VVVPDPTLGVHEVQSGPVVVVERLPDGVVVVHHHRVADVPLCDGAAHVAEVALELELRCLHADDHQSSACVLVPPRTHIGERAQPVDAGVGAETDQHHATPELRRRQRRTVQPSSRPVERRQLSFDRELIAMTKHDRAALCRQPRLAGTRW